LHFEDLQKYAKSQNNGSFHELWKGLIGAFLK
jgi:hypothetical protein